MKCLSVPALSTALALSLAAMSVQPAQAQWRWHGPGAVGAGIVTGLLLGGALAARPYYWGYGPPHVYDAPPDYGEPLYDDAIAYCMRRFRSYDPASGTYLGYDGRRHLCP